MPSGVKKATMYIPVNNSLPSSTKRATCIGSLKKNTVEHHTIPVLLLWHVLNSERDLIIYFTPICSRQIEVSSGWVISKKCTYKLCQKEKFMLHKISIEHLLWRGSTCGLLPHLNEKALLWIKSVWSKCPGWCHFH
jgi:hypothetical protein